MKLTTVLLMGLSVEAIKKDRKVPPRHPRNRLARLANRLAVQTIRHPGLDWSDKRKDRVLGNIANFANKMMDRFNSEHCGYYSSTVGNGGPDPAGNELRVSGKARNPVSDRKRRAGDEDWKNFSHVANDSEYMWLYEACYTKNYEKLSDDQWDFYTDMGDDLCEEDDESCSFFDDEDCSFKGSDGGQRVRGKNGKKKSLNNDPQIAWKQVTTGLKKWSQRYIANCHGMRKANKPANRATALYKRWVQEFPVGAWPVANN